MAETGKTKQGTYYVRWRHHGKYRRKTFKYAKDRDAFVENLASERRVNNVAASRTVENYCDLYIAAAKSRCKPKTLRGYEDGVKPIREFFRNVKVGTLVKSDAQAYWDHLVKTKPKCTTRSRRAMYRTFTAVLQMVVDDEGLPSNPATKLKLPTSHSQGEPKFNPRPLSTDEVEAIAKELPKPYDLLVRFTANTGLRRGEIAGLNVGDLDLIRNTVSVERVPEYGEPVDVMTTPKSEKSVRTVRLPAFLADELAAYLRTHPHSTDRDAPLWPGRTLGGARHGAIDYGKRLEPESFAKNVFTRAVTRSKVSGRVRFHDLRHTYAVQCLMAGMSIYELSEQLGHSSISITLDVYSRWLPREETVHPLDAARSAGGNVVPLRRREA